MSNTVELIAFVRAAKGQVTNRMALELAAALETAEAQRDTLAEALREIATFPLTDYHVGAAQRTARAALAAVEPPEEQP